ncbi:MAG: SMP-30/gluconolactonase/LRE family protein [Bacteroidia bacterium]|nr:SMP-30/gluconolactonase/LRE family protein [Bacteroidia bacterium]
MKKLFFLAFIVLASSCSTKESNKEGYIEQLDPSLAEIMSPDAQVELLGQGFDWSEGPLWVESQKMLLFTDVPKNVIHKWTEEKGVEVYLTPSGFTGEGLGGREPGANGLALDADDNLLLCQHGDRRVARMIGSWDQPLSNFTTLAGGYNGKKFNSPNDLVFYNNDIYFTDPPYGLAADSLRELPYQGVYKAGADGTVTLLVDSLTRPNGIGLSPDHKKMYIANSDPERVHWYEYELSDSGAVIRGKIFYNAGAEAKLEKGSPDGFKVDSKGNIFATGPGGVWIFNAAGKVLGKIKLPNPTANCALTPDNKTLFITSDMKLLRVKLRE